MGVAVEACRKSGIFKARAFEYKLGNPDKPFLNDILGDSHTGIVAEYLAKLIAADMTVFLQMFVSQLFAEIFMDVKADI